MKSSRFGLTPKLEKVSDFSEKTKKKKTWFGPKGSLTTKSVVLQKETELSCLPSVIALSWFQHSLSQQKVTVAITKPSHKK